MTTNKRKPKAKSAKPKGAQPGNKNAQRHGFYSKNFTIDEKKRLDAQDDVDVLAEINLLRVMLDKLKKQISFVAIKRKDANDTEFRDSHYINQLNTLAAMTQSLSTLVRTHYLTHGKVGDIQTSILTALEELRLEMGI